MDEGEVRRHAEEHAQATVEGDLSRAGRDLSPGAVGNARTVMEAFPSDLRAWEIRSVTASGNEWVVDIAYLGTDSEALVRSRWKDDEGTPRIASLELPSG